MQKLHGVACWLGVPRWRGKQEDVVWAIQVEVRYIYESWFHEDVGTRAGGSRLRHFTLGGGQMEGLVIS